MWSDALPLTAIVFSNKRLTKLKLRILTTSDQFTETRTSRHVMLNIKGSGLTLGIVI